MDKVMDKEDIVQELELQKIMGNYKYAMKRVYSVQRSAAWSNSYKRKFSHVSIEEIYYDNRGKVVVISDSLVDKTDWANLVELKIDLELFMSTLTSRERRILMLYYSDGYTMKEIGALCNTHYTTVSKIIKRSLQKIRKFCSPQLPIQQVEQTFDKTDKEI
jgi:RNA polymerase sigma factor (sigma-70 family)